MTPWLTIVGIGDGGLDSLTPEARRHLDAALTVFGGERHLAMLRENSAQTRIAWRSPFADSLAEIRARAGTPTTVLATGDPMWFGVGATLAAQFGPDEMKILPAPSAFSLTAARVGWPLQDCACLTVHGRPAEAVLRHLASGARLLVYSEDAESPATLAALLTARGFGASRILVCEHLGGPRERVRETRACGFDLADIADLNTLAIECDGSAGGRSWSPASGLPDEAFVHDGKMTKPVMRAMAIAALEPFPGQLLWDVGAGCGSVSVEWMRAAARTRAIAIEPIKARRAMIRENAKALGTPEIEIVAAEAPEAFRGLERPDAVFIGGGMTDGVFAAAWEALPAGGRMVAHAVTLESEAILLDLHARFGGEMIRVSVDRAAPVGSYRGWKPAMPVIHWHVTKGISA